MPLTYWFFIIGVLLLTIFVSYGTFATARLLQHWQPERNILLLPAENLLRVALILTCLGLGWLSGLSKAQLGWQFPQPIKQLTLGTLIGLGVGLFFYFATRWLMARTGQRFYSSILIELVLPASNRELLLVLLAMGPVVLLEELLFRSLLLGGLSPILPVWLLLVGLSVLFGALHSPQGVWGMVGAGMIGLLFGLLFLWQQSLLLPVTAHYVINALQITLVWRFFNRPPTADH